MESYDTHLSELTARIGEVRAVLFDLDGTLIDTMALILVSLRHATEQVLGISLSDEELMLNVGIPLWDQMRIISEEHEDELVFAYRVHNRAVHDDLVREYEGVDEVLRELKSREIPLGIVTSKSRGIACQGMDLFGLRGYFDVLICADDVDVHKPDPFPLHEAADALGVPLDQCIYIGDSSFDMMAAINGGAISVAALWGAFSEEAVLEPGPDFALSSISELPDLLDGAADEYVVRQRGSGTNTE